MNQADDPADTVQATRVPADISRPDRILGPFTAQQTAVIAAAAVVLYAGYWAARPFMAPVAYVALVVPVAGAVAALALGRRARHLQTQDLRRGEPVHQIDTFPPAPTP